MAEARTDDVRHAQAAAFIEGSSGFFFKVNFLKKEIQSIYSLKGQRGDQRSKTLSQKGGGGMSKTNTKKWERADTLFQSVWKFVLKFSR